MDTTTIRVREPRELLALLPYQLGFQPEDSAVVVSLRPPRGRVGLIARVDLEDLADPAGGPELARRLVTHLVGDGAGRAVLVLYTGEDPRPWPGALPPGDGGRGGRGAARRAVLHVRRAAEPFLGEVAAWVVGPTGYGSLDCADAGCCPPGGRPLRELQATQVGAHMVLAGAMVADSRQSLVPDVPASAAARRNAARAAARAAARRSRAHEQGPAALVRWRTAALSTWRRTLAAGPEQAAGSAAVLGRLVVALDDAAVRDAVLLTLVADAGDLPERSVAVEPSSGPVGGEVSAALAAIVDADAGVPPEAAVVAAATGVLERVVSHARGRDRAPALTLLGLLAWWHGDGARAAVLVDRALAADPSHRLAALVSDALAAGLAPGWVRGTPRPRG